MAIKTIEIMCLPCSKCEKIKRLITETIRQIEIENKTKITYTFQHTPNLAQIARYSVNAAQAPIVIINGNVEMCGLITSEVAKKRLEALHRF